MILDSILRITLTIIGVFALLTAFNLLLIITVVSIRALITKWRKKHR